MSTVPQETLLRAANVLQKAHDYIEVNGFDISSYEPNSWDEHQEKGKAPCCYIGSVRLAAGVDPEPPQPQPEDWNEEKYGEWFGDPYQGDAGAGDGPELVVALETLDAVALEDLTNQSLNSVERYNVNRATPTGRFVEELGFQVSSNLVGGGLDREERFNAEKDHALALLRRALTRIHA